MNYVELMAITVLLLYVAAYIVRCFNLTRNLTHLGRRMWKLTWKTTLLLFAGWLIWNGYFIQLILSLVLLIVLGAFFIGMLFSLPYWGIYKQFKGRKEDELEEIIFNNQLNRLKEVTGMSLPPYEVKFQEPVTDLNGSFYGVIFVKFKEPLTDEYLKELEKRIKDAPPSGLWRDGHLVTTMIFKLHSDVHEMWLKYTRKHYDGVTYTGGFRISDERNAKNVPINPIDIFNYFRSSPFKFTNQFLLPSKVEKVKLLPIKASNV